MGYRGKEITELALGQVYCYYFFLKYDGVMGVVELMMVNSCVNTFNECSSKHDAACLYHRNNASCYAGRIVPWWLLTIRVCRHPQASHPNPCASRSCWPCSFAGSLEVIWKWDASS